MKPLLEKAEILDAPDVERALGVPHIELPGIDNASALLAHEKIKPRQRSSKACCTRV